MQPNPSHLRRGAQFPPEVAERVGVILTADVVNDDEVAGADIVRSEL
jgi:hypothetical protein